MNVADDLPSAEEALDLVDYGLKLNLLLTDHLMPGSTGKPCLTLVRHAPSHSEIIRRDLPGSSE